MIAAAIRAALRDRLLVILAAIAMAGWGIWSLQRTPLDALPDLSDVQVIVRASYPGKAPQIVEDQITYPLTTTMLSVPGAKTVRGFSMFGDAYVYVLFEDGTDLYWARSRVLEYLSQVQSQLPEGAEVSLGPDATGVGWIFEYALVDRSGKHSLADLRAIQDWNLKFELKTVPNVSGVASVGGMVRQYQVIPDPARLRSLNITHQQLIDALKAANQEGGGLGAGDGRSGVYGAHDRVSAKPGGLPQGRDNQPRRRAGDAFRRGYCALRAGDPPWSG